MTIKMNIIGFPSLPFMTEMLGRLFRANAGIDRLKDAITRRPPLRVEAARPGHVRAAGAALWMVAFIAVALPAWRALRIDPARVQRVD